jgi:hypothetical protein
MEVQLSLALLLKCGSKVFPRNDGCPAVITRDIQQIAALGEFATPVIRAAHAGSSGGFGSTCDGHRALWLVVESCATPLDVTEPTGMCAAARAIVASCAARREGSVI